MKTIILILAVLVAASSCKKSKPAYNGVTYAQFNFSNQYGPDGQALIIENKPIVKCIYNSNTPATYLFKFIDTTFGKNGIEFVITGDASGKISTNQTFNYSYAASGTSPSSTQCIYYNAVAGIMVVGLDSAHISINFFRYSGGSVDGKFSGGIWGGGPDSVLIRNGFFYGIPITNQ